MLWYDAFDDILELCYVSIMMWAWYELIGSKTW